MSKNSTAHITDSELLQLADGELSSRRAAAIEAHLAACGSCRARHADVERTISEFVQDFEREKTAELPPIEPARFRLEAGIERLAVNTRISFLERASGFLLDRRRLAYAGSGLALVLLYFFVARVGTPQLHAALVPDSRLTPGAARSVTREDICAAHNDDEWKAVPSTVAHRVFEEYGIHNPAPRAYEVDYLITPALGGSTDIQNLWPQPYAAGTWNSHVKDALEDRLLALVCEGMIDLPTAQHDISSDWIAAYKKYFRTREPLQIHAGFALDPPWE